MGRIVMLVTNSFTHDPRVQQEAAALSRSGYAVTVLAWDRQGAAPVEEIVDGVAVVRCRVVSGYGLGPRQLAYLPRYWWWAYRKGRSLRPDVVHCHDLDTVPAGLLLGRACGCPVIFDAHEHLPSSLAGRAPAWFVRLARAAERWMVRRTTGVVTVGERLQELYRSAGARRVAVVGNYKNAADFGLPAAERRELDRELQLPPGRTICYLGGLTPSRAILQLLDAAAGLPGINVLVAGWGSLATAVHERCHNQPNLRYLGRVPLNMVPKYTAYSDAVYYVLERGYPNNHFSTPNKLFEALAAGKPIICASGVGEIADIVADTGCGLLVPSSEVASVRHALNDLQEAWRYSQMAAAACQAYTDRYSWSRSEQVLLAFYAEVRNRSGQLATE